LNVTSVVLHPVELGLICVGCFAAGMVVCAIISELIDWRFREGDDD